MAVALTAAVPQAGQQAPKPTQPAPAAAANPRVATLKAQVMADVNGMYDLGQQMTDMVFSFGELGFQEFETQRYLGRHPQGERLHRRERRRRHSRRRGWPSGARASR